MSLKINSNCSSHPYSFNKMVSQDLAEGIYPDIDTHSQAMEEINDLKGYLPTLAQDVVFKNTDIKDSLLFYAQTVGYENIKRQMKTGEIVNDFDMTHHIKMISKSFITYGFKREVRLFRTEGDTYTQDVRGNDITSRELQKGDTWKFAHFISTSVTNQPVRPKLQEGNLTIFVFKFDYNQDIRGLYLEGTVGKKGENEFLLAPADAEVTDSYDQKIALGYVVKKAHFVVCKLKFPPKPDTSL